jgi:hypothetical protein
MGQPIGKASNSLAYGFNPLANRMNCIDSFRVFGFSFGKTNQFLSSLTFLVLNEVFVAALLFRSARNT